MLRMERCRKNIITNVPLPKTPTTNISRKSMVIKMVSGRCIGGVYINVESVSKPSIAFTPEPMAPDPLFEKLLLPPIKLICVIFSNVKEFFHITSIVVATCCNCCCSCCCAIAVKDACVVRAVNVGADVVAVSISSDGSIMGCDNMLPTSINVKGNILTKWPFRPINATLKLYAKAIVAQK